MFSINKILFLEDLLSYPYFSRLGFECAFTICRLVLSGVVNSISQILHLFVNFCSFLKIDFTELVLIENFGFIQNSEIWCYKELLNIVNLSVIHNS